jgi:hypothetical protein
MEVHRMAEWHHVPTEVNVFRHGAKRRAKVKTHLEWSILEDERSTMPLRVMIFLPTELEPRPLLFETRRDAREWLDTQATDEVRSFDWRALEESDGSPSEQGTHPPPEQRAHHSLTLYSKYDGDGWCYEVPPGPPGVLDWPGQAPPTAQVPEWMPRSFETSGRSDLSGHWYSDPSVQTLLCLVGNHRCNLPFPVLDSASTD